MIIIVLKNYPQHNCFHWLITDYHYSQALITDHHCSPKLITAPSWSSWLIGGWVLTNPGSWRLDIQYPSILTGVFPSLHGNSNKDFTMETLASYKINMTKFIQFILCGHLGKSLISILKRKVSYLPPGG